MKKDADSATKWLDSILGLAACARCQNTEHAVYRAGVCRHCYNIQLEISRFEKSFAKTRLFTDEFYLKVAQKMRDLAEDEGKAFGKVPAETSGLDVEHIFSALSKRVLKKNLFHGYATHLGHSFSPDQRRLLVYLLGRILREEARRSRRYRAGYSDLTGH